MEEFKDQIEKDKWFKLTDPDGNPVPGKIRLSIHFVHSYTKLLADVLDQKSNEKTQFQNRMEYIEQILAKFQGNTK